MTVLEMGELAVRFGDALLDVLGAPRMGATVTVVEVRELAVRFGDVLAVVSLGGLIADGARTASYASGTFWFAVGLLVLMILAVNLSGHALRDAFGPTSNGGRR
ncbi:hypothetical protein GCM10009555_006800 [Acrocarpospora macrocephala]|uniref:Uncharacterized protein n=1 Tax=Acrocarpospora macrocephala TaxID=150177 RepID=A0A5M3X4T2_9ACTN|nr:hypothetical protein [Acrocarpospora macrocephala]GES13148.1 hypothetical protein Amac_067450 [Acrocarpospora macrocephala]